MAYDGPERSPRPITPARRYAQSDVENRRLRDTVFPRRGSEPKYPNEAASARQWLFDRLPGMQKNLAFLWSTEVVMDLKRRMLENPDLRFRRRPDPLRMLSFLPSYSQGGIKQIHETAETPKPAKVFSISRRGLVKEADAPMREKVSRTPRLGLSKEAILGLVVSGQLDRSSADAMLKEIA